MAFSFGNGSNKGQFTTYSEKTAKEMVANAMHHPDKWTVQVQKSNPKRGKSAERFETYAGFSGTLAEFAKTEAKKGDLLFDLERGFLELKPIVSPDRK